MEDGAKKLLREQLQLLSEVAKEQRHDPKILCDISAAMVDIARVISTREFFRSAEK